MADDQSRHEQQDEGAQQGGTEDGAQGTPGADSSDGLKDKHGEDAINLGRHNRLMAEKDAEIAKLRQQLKEASGEASKGADALKKIAELEAKLADEKVSGDLKGAGCINLKAAKS